MVLTGRLLNFASNSPVKLHHQTTTLVNQTYPCVCGSHGITVADDTSLRYAIDEQEVCLVKESLVC